MTTILLIILILIILINSISKYFYKLYIIKQLLIQNNYNYNNFINDLNLNLYWIKNITNLLRNINLNKLKYILNSLLKFDIKVKKQNINIKYIEFKLLLLDFIKD